MLRMELSQGCGPEILSRSGEDLMSRERVSESLAYVFVAPWWGHLGTVKDRQLCMSPVTEPWL